MDWCQILDIILGSKENCCYQKMSITKKCASKFIFSNEKNMKKIWMIFHKKIDFESKILALLDTFPQ